MKLITHISSRRSLAVAIRSRLIIAGLLLVGIVQHATAQTTYSLSNLWIDANGVGSLANTGNNRGIAYGAASNLLFVSTRLSGTTGVIDVYNPATGALLSGTNIVGGNLGIDQIGVADDGVLYGLQLATAVTTGAPVRLYSWTNWTAGGAYLAYQSTNATDPVIVLSQASKRVGDTMAVTGSGTNTLILATVSGTCTNFLLLHTSDGVNFISTTLQVTGLPTTGGNILGISFYTNNSILVQPGSGASSRNIYLISYPTNFASQSNVVGTILGSAAGLSAAADEFLSYSPSGQLLASLQTQTAASTTCTLSLNSVTNFTTSINQVATASVPTPNANGNATGGCALGGPTKTNYLFELESNNGLRGYQVIYSVGPVGPTVSAPTGGITNAYPPQTLTVTATGTTPLYYQWYSVSTNGLATNLIIGANTNFYTATTPVTNLFFVVVTNAALTANSVTSSMAGLQLLTPITNSVVTPLWTGAVGAYSNFLASDDKTRGIGYDTNTQTVVVSTETAIFLLDGSTGSNFGALNVSGLYGGATFLVDQVGVADDGVVYAGNLATAGQDFMLNQWPSATNTTATASQAFALGNDPGQDGRLERLGDTMAVRGAGPNTQVLLGSKAAVKVSLLTTGDGLNFSPTPITISGVSAGFAGNGVAFGAGNTFWAKSYLGDLYEISYDPVAQTGSVVLDYSTAGQIPSHMSGLAVDMTNNILAGVDFDDINNDLRLYQLTGTANPPVLFDEAFFPSYNANGNENAAIVMKYPLVYGLDVNNGIVAVTYGIPATTSPHITTPPASQSVYAGQPATLSVSASGSLPIYYQWQFMGSNISNATNQSYNIPSTSTNNEGSYDVIVNNIGGAVTSTPPAVLTVLLPVEATNYVTNLYALAAGSRPYLGSIGYGTRGLAYDTNSGCLFIAETSGNIFALAATNGADVGTVNTSGLPATGFGRTGGFLLDQVGVADDGVLYGANLADTSSGDQFCITGWASPATNGGAGFAAYQSQSGDVVSNTQQRFGDDMAVRGAGTNTQLLFGSYTGSNVVLFTTSDGMDFSPIVLTCSDTNVTPGFASLGIAFGSGNTFWAKGGHNFNLRLCSFDTNLQTITVLQTYLAGTQTPNNLEGLSMDTNMGVLGGVCLDDSPNDFQLYQPFGNATPPALFNQAFFATQNPNGQGNAASTLKPQSLA